MDASFILARSGRMDLIQPGSPCEPLYAGHPHKPGSHQQTHCVLYGSQMLHKLALVCVCVCGVCVCVTIGALTVSEVQHG